MKRLVFPFRLMFDRWARPTFNASEEEWFARYYHFAGYDRTGAKCN